MSKRFTHSIAPAICFGILAMQPATAKAMTSKRIDEEKNPSAKTRSSSSLNNHAIKIYPDAISRAMHVVAKGNEGKQIDFFIFDLQGELMKHYKLDEGDHKKITGLRRGKYIYHVFCGDEETATGKLDIR
ncbi:hypothetical protein [Terrimonas pollutisoli]|uniref:hypothetical protein n=1 Tax=Terrimonas pollutisoli TaxID=3034147 RepID=UPI0023EC80A1|nr:hypothetical protein [Terrimonas sp. H1YJ31]